MLKENTIVENMIIDLINKIIDKSNERLTLEIIKKRTGLKEYDIRKISLESLEYIKDRIRINNLTVRLNK